MPCDLRVFQFPRDDIPYRTLADVFILLRSFKQSEIAVSNELDCVRGHIAHMSIWGDHEHIVMGKDGKSNQSLPAPFLNCQSCSCSSLLCIFCMCSFGLVRQKPLQHSNELMTNNYQVSNTQLHIQAIQLNRSRKKTIRLKQVGYSVTNPQNIITDSIKNTVYRQLRGLQKIAATFSNTF